MHKPSPQEDEQAEYSPPQRRRQVTQPRRLSMEHGPDEHPEIPLIRRASLHLDQQAVSDPVEPEEEEEEASKAKAAATHRPASRRSTNKPVTTHRGYRYINTSPP